MHFVWWVLTIIFALFSLVFFIGIINPKISNQKLKEGEKPFGRKQAFWSFIVCFIILLLFSNLATGNSSEKASSKPVSKSNSKITKNEAPVKQPKPQPQKTIKSNDNNLSNSVQNPNEEAIAASQGKGSDFKQGPDKVAAAGGLGDTYGWIQTMFGEPTMVMQKMNQGVGMYKFQDGKIEVDFVQGRANHVTYDFDSNPISLEQAKLYSKKLLPPDAKFIKEYTYEDNQLIDVYQSNSLTPLFGSDWFSNTNGDVQPGYCDMAYLIDTGKVNTVDSFVSDNP